MTYIGCYGGVIWRVEIQDGAGSGSSCGRRARIMQLVREAALAQRLLVVRPCILECTHVAGEIRETFRYHNRELFLDVRRVI